MAFLDVSEIYSTPFVSFPVIKLLREKIMIGETESIVFISYLRQNSQHFAYLALPLERLSILNLDIELGRMTRLQDYGRVLLEGEGNPSEEQKNFMELHYAFDHTDPFADDEEMLNA